MLIADDPDDRVTLGLLREMLGRHVSLARDDKAALDLAASQSSLMLLGLGVPSSGGFAAPLPCGATLRRSAWLQGLPRISDAGSTGGRLALP